MYSPLNLNIPSLPMNMPKFSGTQLSRLNRAKNIVFPDDGFDVTTSHQKKILKTVYITMGETEFTGKQVLGLIAEIIKEENRPALSRLFGGYRHKTQLEKMRYDFNTKNYNAKFYKKSGKHANSAYISWGRDKDLSVGIITEQLLNSFPDKRHQTDLLRALHSLNEVNLLKVDYLPTHFQNGSGKIVINPNDKELLVFPYSNKEEENNAFTMTIHRSGWPDFISLPFNSIPLPYPAERFLYSD